MKHKNALLTETALLCLILATYLLAAKDWQTAQGVAAKVTRLQIIGNTDSEEDQRVKLLVRDRVTSWINELTENITDPQEARTVLRANLPQIEKIAAETVTANGFFYPVQAVMEETEYPFRNYGNFALPEGNYLALRIKLGKAEGKNWWCVAFPGLCEPYAEIDDGCLSREERKLIEGERPEVRFFLLECFQRLMQKHFMPEPPLT